MREKEREEEITSDHRKSTQMLPQVVKGVWKGGV